MSFLNMYDNLRNDQSVYQPKNISTTPINSLYQKFYNINKMKNKCYYNYQYLTLFHLSDKILHNNLIY